MCTQNYASIYGTFESGQDLFRKLIHEYTRFIVVLNDRSIKKHMLP